MLHFNELYVTEDNKELVIDVEIDDVPEYDDCYLDEVNVCIAADCSERSPFDKYVTVWKPPVYFDIDGDGTYTSKDLEAIKTLLNLTVAYNNTSDNNLTAYPNVYKDSTGYYYYFTEYDEDGNPVHIRKELDDYLFRIWAHTIDTYHDPNLNAVGSLPFYVCMYLSESLEPFVYEIVSGGKPYTGVRGDLNGDGDVNIADINRLISFLKDMNEELVSELFKARIKHVQICKNVNDLAGLGILPNESLDKLFFVRATAFCLTEAAANTVCGCDSAEITGVAYNGLPIYNNIMSMIDSTLGNRNDCSLSDFSSFEDLMLNYYGFKFAVDCGDLCAAYNYWASLMGYSTGNSGSSKCCGCHGTY